MGLSPLLAQMAHSISGIPHSQMQLLTVQGQRFKASIERMWARWCWWDYFLHRLFWFWSNLCLCCFIRLVKGIPSLQLVARLMMKGFLHNNPGLPNKIMLHPLKDDEMKPKPRKR
jgi:hypothetical protein